MILKSPRRPTFMCINELFRLKLWLRHVGCMAALAGPFVPATAQRVGDAETVQVDGILEVISSPTTVY